MKKPLLTLLASLSIAISGSAQIQNYTVGQTITDFTVTDTYGTVHNLYNYTAQGKWVILDFFFDTCPPCQSTSPIFSELHEKYGCNGGDIICIAMNNGSDNNAEVIAYENTYGGSSVHPPAISSQGGAGAVDIDLNPAAYPTYCLIGPDNTLKHADIWPVTSITSFENAFASVGFSPTVMSCATGITDNTNQLEINFYPNPANDFVNIGLNAASDQNDATMNVYNVLGEVIYSSKINLITGTNQIQLSTADYSNGQYITHIILSDGTVYRSDFQVIR